MKRISLRSRIAASIVAAALLLASVPTILFTLTSATELGTVTKVSDPSTIDNWKTLFPSDNTEMAGRIWTDKSVFTDTSAFSGLVNANGDNVDLSLLNKNNFLVALSALGSNKSIVGYSCAPTDTILVLDVSNSMKNNNYVDDLVSAANSAMQKLLELNKHNRVGVIIYSSSSTVVLPLDRYTQKDNTFLLNYGQSYILINSGVQNSKMFGTNRYMSTEYYSVSGATYTQSGVFSAMKRFSSITDTAIPEGEIQAGTKRTPVLVVMSDGLPTYGTSYINGRSSSATTIGNSNMGDGGVVSDTVLQNGIDFVNQLTTANAVYNIKSHYGTDPLVYTLGLGANDEDLSSATLDPASHKNTDELWNDYLKTNVGSNLIFDIETVKENNNNGRPNRPGGSTTQSPNRASVERLASITSIDQKNYVTEHFSASNATGLISAFDKIVKQIIIQSLYYPTLVDGNGAGVNNNGFIEFIDDIGHYMEIKDIKGIVLGDHFFTGERLASNFVPSGGDFFGEDGSYTDLANNVVYTVMSRIGIKTIAEARDLINLAYQYGQLSYTSADEWSNYIGWYADANGNYMGHWHEGHTEADIPVVNGVKATYINKSYGMLGEITGDYTETDLMYISTQVHTRISDGNVSLIWRIPASLIPIVSYNIRLDGETIEDAEAATIEYVENTPIRLLFEVGLVDDINAVNLNEAISDSRAHIKDENGDGISDDGKYYFYTNWWNDDNLTHYNPSKTEDMIVFFEPSRQNERYYYSENTPILVLKNGKYVRYSGSMPSVTDGNTYYREYYVFEGTSEADKDGLMPAKITKLYERMSNETIGSLTSECTNDNGEWFVPMGVVHRVLDVYRIEKTDNTTETIEYVAYPTIGDYDQTDNVIYVGSILGNNGRLAIDIPQGIKITKAIDDTLHGTDSVYTFTVTADGVNGVYNSYIVNSDGAMTAGSVTFTNGSATVQLKAGQSVYILGISENTSYTVSEVINGDYKVSSITVNGQPIQSTSNAVLSFEKHNISETVFTNTLSVNTGTIIVRKEVIVPSGITADPTQKFNFEYYKRGDEANKQTFSITFSETKMLADLSAGKYIIKEINIPSGYSSNANNDTIEIVVDNNSTEAYSAHFVNTYSPTAVKPLNVIVNGTKTLSGRDWMEGDSFSFALQVLQGNKWITLDTQTVEFDESKDTNASYDFSFDFASSDALKEYAIANAGETNFRIIEIIPEDKLGGVTYDDIYRYFNVFVTDTDLDGALEISSVTGTSTVTVTTDISTGSPIWTVSAAFNNKYAASTGDSLVITVNKTVTDSLGIGIGKNGFTFGLYAVGGTEPILTSQPTDINGVTTFKLTFPARFAGQTLTYEIREIVPEDSLMSMEYDAKKITVDIKIVDNYDGTVSAFISDGGDYSNELSVAFTNVYKPDSVTISLGGKKVMAGRNFAAGEFSFKLFDGATQIDEATNSSKADGGYFTFDPITVSTIGTKTYTISEVNGSLGGVTYSDKVYTVVVTTTDDANNDGYLDVSVTVDGTPITLDAMKDTVVFTNVYNIENGSISITGVKILNNKSLNGNDFRFALCNENGTVIEEVFNAADGSITFTSIPVTEECELVFKVYEIVGNDETITYDNTVFIVKVSVKDNGDGTFDIDYVYEIENGNAAADGIVFTNSYEALVIPPENPDTSDRVKAVALSAVAVVSTATVIALLKKKRRRIEE